MPQIKLNNTLPYLVSNIVEVLEVTAPAFARLPVSTASECLGAISSANFDTDYSPTAQVSPEDEDEEDGATADVDSQRKGKCVVLKTSTRQTIFLPVRPFSSSHPLTINPSPPQL